MSSAKEQRGSTRPRAFVTGASRGIGKAIALALAETGYDVIVSARTMNPGEQRDNSLTTHHTDSRPLPGSLSETVADIEALGGRALAVPMDLLDRASVGAAAQFILDRPDWCELDVIVHNGRHLGAGLMDVFMDTPVEAYPKFVEAHAIAPIILTRMLLPSMLARGAGTIINITSTAAYEVPPAPGGKGGWGLAYAVGKAAGHQLVGTLHAEFAGAGIRAFNLQPGFIATERNKTVAEDPSFLQGAAPPSVIGAVVAWLVSAEEAAELSGTNIEGQAFCRDRDLHPAWD